ncbi:MAG: adenylate/guanylate cyclase domain-containing protein [Deltaproteobacteria bacterium]|nr:adenylate/guanylate cyclase domain-containing protein [Deltaproteobacteria bacterium]
MLDSFVTIFVKAGCLPDDTRGQVIRKTAMMLLVSLYALLSFFWGTTYLLLGLKTTALIPYAYGGLSILTLLFLFGSKRYDIFRCIQLGLILLIPFLVQWSLGGFGPSGAVMIWSVLAPIGALMFSGPARAWPWFIVYLALTLIELFFDIFFPLPEQHIPETVSAVSFVFNIGGVTSITFVLLRYFVQKGEETISDLDAKHSQVSREKERLNKIKSVMANFVPETAKRMIEENPEKELLNKYIQDASVLFLDIEGFAVLTEKYPYETINRTIEHYFSIFFDLIKKRGGDINETAGDGMMVIFLGTGTRDHAENAVRAALDIRNCCPSHNGESSNKGFLPITVNIGISSGEVYLGSTKLRGGEWDRWTFTASGPVTVLAARLSNYAQGGRVLVGRETARRVGETVALKEIEGVKLKNMGTVGPVYEVV